jgi:polysaccharide deacetylase family protein (PEP-CTERM system associated)
MASSNAMTVDVEDYFHVQALSTVVTREAWNSMEYRVEANTLRLADLFDSRGIQATFFVLGWVAEKSPGLVRELHQRGHEIACHGYSHRLVYEQSAAGFRDETLRSKKLLEDITGSSVLGYRAASYSVTKQSLWALDILLEAGFAYDSSVFPIRHGTYGIPNAQLGPHRLATPAGGVLLEFPMSAANIAGLRMPVAGGGYFRLLPYWLIAYGLQTIVDEGRPLIFYLHPWEIDTTQPRVRGLPWLSRLRHYTNLRKTYSRLECLTTRFAFTSVREVLRSGGWLP